MLDLGPVYLDLSTLPAPPASAVREPAASYGVAGEDYAPFERLRSQRDFLGQLAAEWHEKADQNAAVLVALPDGSGSVRVWLEGVVETEQDAARLGLALAHAALAFRTAAAQLLERRREIEALLVQQAMGARWEQHAARPEPPATPPVQRPTAGERKRCEVILSLRGRRYGSPSHYAAEIGRRCTGPQGEQVGHSAVLGWLRRRGLYHGRGTDVDRMKAAAEAYAEQVMGEGGASSG